MYDILCSIYMFTNTVRFAGKIFSLKGYDILYLLHAHLLSSKNINAFSANKLNWICLNINYLWGLYSFRAKIQALRTNGQFVFGRFVFIFCLLRKDIVYGVNDICALYHHR